MTSPCILAVDDDPGICRIPRGGAYGLPVKALLPWALHPNIQRPLNGSERGVRWRAKKNESSNERHDQ